MLRKLALYSATTMPVKLLFLSTILMLLSWAACKKEVAPELKVLVVDTLDNPLRNINVVISVGTASGGVVDKEVIAEGKTDNFGTFYHEFPNTVLVDVLAYYIKSANDTLKSETSILLESRVQKGKQSNQYEQKLILGR